MTTTTKAVIAAAVSIARGWPTPAIRLRGGKVAVPVNAIALAVPPEMVRMVLGDIPCVVVVA